MLNQDFIDPTKVIEGGMRIFRIEVWNANNDLFKTIIAVAEDFDAAVSMVYAGLKMDDLHIGKMEQLHANLVLQSRGNRELDDPDYGHRMKV